MPRLPDDLRALLRAVRTGDAGAMFALADWLEENHDYAPRVLAYWKRMQSAIRWYDGEYRAGRRRVPVAENARRWVRSYLRVLRQVFRPGWTYLGRFDDVHLDLAEALWKHARALEEAKATESV